jgi:hypothetical protein
MRLAFAPIPAQAGKSGKSFTIVRPPIGWFCGGRENQLEKRECWMSAI